MDINIHRYLRAAENGVKDMPGHDPKTLRAAICLPDTVTPGFNFRRRFSESAPLRKRGHGYHADTVLAYALLLDEQLGGRFAHYPRFPWAVTYLAAGASGWHGTRRVPVFQEDAVAAIARLNSPLFD